MPPFVGQLSPVLLLPTVGELSLQVCEPSWMTESLVWGMTFDPVSPVVPPSTPVITSFHSLYVARLI